MENFVKKYMYTGFFLCFTHKKNLIDLLLLFSIKIFQNLSMKFNPYKVIFKARENYQFQNLTSYKRVVDNHNN